VSDAAVDTELQAPDPPDAPDRAALLEALQERIGHRFSDPDLLEAALTHSSWSNEHGGTDYERLEFLGDAVADAIIARRLYLRFPGASEAILSRQKHRLISAEPLARIGRELGLGHVLRVGTGARKQNVHHQAAKLEDATEALVGALALDAGLVRATEIVEPWFDHELAGLVEERPKGKRAYKDPVSKLYEACDRKPVRTRPHQIVLDRTGPENDLQFRVGWWLGGELLGEGTGPRIKSARREAARESLARLQELLAQGWLPDRSAQPPEDQA